MNDPIVNERRAIERARAIQNQQLAKWQVQAGYYLALLNNRALSEGSASAITLRFTPGEAPRLERVKVSAG